MIAVSPYIIKQDFEKPVYQPYGGCDTFFHCTDPEVIASGPAECLAGDTKIFDYATSQEYRIDDMAELGLRPTVLTLQGYETTGVPFCKGEADLYRVTSEDGKSFTATAKHLILTNLGWCYVGDLGVSDILLGYASSHLLTSSERDLSIPLQDARSYAETIPGSLCGCLAYRHSYDERLRQVEDSGQYFSPLQGDVPSHNYGDLQMGGRASLSENIHPYLLSVRPSIDHSYPSADSPKMADEGYYLQRYTSSHDGDLFQQQQQLQSNSRHLRSSCATDHHFVDRQFVSSLPPYTDYTVFGCTVSSIEYIGRGLYYDLTVPLAGHYTTSDGIIHHNTGKTLAACWKIHLLACKYPEMQGSIVRKTQKSVYGSVLQTYERILKSTKAPVVPYGGETPQKYIYANGSEIWVGGLDNPEKVLSSERDIIYFNQAEEGTLNDWEMLTTRTTGRSSVIRFTQLIGDCNPAGTLHYIRKRAADGVLTLIPTVHRDNPTLYDPKTGEITQKGIQVMARLSNLTGVRRKRLFEGIWATAEGAVYDTFDPAIHVRERAPEEMKSWYLAQDEGYTHPAVILLVGMDSDGRLHVFREFYKTRVLQKDVVAVDLEWSREHTLDLVAVDEAAAGLIADLRDVDLPARGYKGRVLDGITSIQARLKVQGDGKPRLTVDPGCTNTINEFESYIWKPEKDEPVKENDHAMDAIRYLDNALGDNWFMS